MNYAHMHIYSNTYNIQVSDNMTSSQTTRVWQTGTLCLHQSPA